MSAGLCPRCGAAATGSFCASCGASLAPVTCPACGTTPAAGARFCNKCGAGLAGQPAPAASGTPSAAPPARADGQLAWWLAGGMLVILIIIVAWPVINPSEPPPAAAAARPAAGPPGAPGVVSPPDLSTMTPREAADRLFNRVMAAVELEDEATVQQFLPMAIQAYDIARPLDDDGVYHLATLKRAGGDFAGALATAQEGLAAKPDHLLMLAAAGDAAEGAGDEAGAKTYWRHFLDVYDVQHALGLEEYLGHPDVLEEARAHAREVVGE